MEKTKQASGILISLKKTTKKKNNNNSASHQFLEVFILFFILEIHTVLFCVFASSALFHCQLPPWAILRAPQSKQGVHALPQHADRRSSLCAVLNDATNKNNNPPEALIFLFGINSSYESLLCSGETSPTERG